jgi:O-antigen/teichoic acid export membrane protein
LAAVTPWLVERILKVPALLQPETRTALYVVGLALPMVTVISALRGVLEAHQRFDLTNVISSLMGVYIFLSPLIVMHFSPHLSWIAFVLLVGRIGVCASYLYVVQRSIPSMRQGFRFSRCQVGSLVRFGGWMTVTNVVGPLMVSLDRFLIGVFVSVTAVAYYATPYEVVTKLWLIPGALMGVLFPAISASFLQDRQRTVQIFHRGVVWIFLILFPVTLLLVLFAQEIMTFWVGGEFSRYSSRPMQLLAIGVLINSLAWVPMALVQGAGRPDLSSRLHLLELPFYLCILWWFLSTWGIIGAALAWLVRVAIDSLCLFYLSQRLLPEVREFFRKMGLPLAGASVCLALAFLPASFSLKGGFYLLVLLTFLAIAWHLILAPGEKEWLMGTLKIWLPRANKVTK